MVRIQVPVRLFNHPVQVQDSVTAQEVADDATYDGVFTDIGDLFVNMTLRISLVLAHTACLWGIVPAQALEPRQSGAIEYVSGGVGDDERAQLNAIRTKYNFHLTLAQAGGEYLNGVDIRLTPARQGEQVIQMRSEGPQFFARLPAGEYLLTATYQGKVQSQKVTIGTDSAANLTLFWPNEGAAKPR